MATLIINTSTEQVILTINQGGSGTVQSVNGKIGTVTLNSDEIPVGTGNLYMTNSEKNKLLDIGSFDVYPVVVPTTGWSFADGFFNYSITNINISADDTVNIVPDNGNTATLIEAEFQARTDAFEGGVKIYANHIPTANFLVTIQILKV